MSEEDKNSAERNDSPDDSFLKTVGETAADIMQGAVSGAGKVGRAILSVVDGGEEEGNSEDDSTGEEESDAAEKEQGEASGSGEDEDVEGGEDDGGSENAGATEILRRHPVLIGGGAVAFVAVFVGTIFAVYAFMGEKRTSDQTDGDGVAAGFTQQDPTSEVVDAADRLLDQGKMKTAKKLYRLGWSQRDDDVKDALVAGVRLSNLLITDKKSEEAAGILREIRNRTYPGSGLWAYAVIGLTHLTRKAGKREKYLQNLYRLRANAGRYAPTRRDAVRAWTEYRLGISKFQACKVDDRGGASPLTIPGMLFGEQKLNQALFSDLMDDVVFRADRTEKLNVEKTMAGVRLTGRGVTLGRFLTAIKEVGARRVVCEDWCDRKVYGEMEEVRPNRAVDIVLGTLGLKRKKREGMPDGIVPMLKEGERRTSQAEALSSLERFVLLYPNSEYVAETYYAISYLHLLEDQPGRALNQVQILLNRFPDSKWTRPANYLAGYVSIENEAWKNAASFMRKAEEGFWTGQLYAKGWMGHILSQMEKWEPAVRKLKPVLNEDIPVEFRGQLTYDLATALEHSSGLNERVRQLYAESRNLVPRSSTAVQALAAMARIAMQDRLPERASELIRRGMQSEHSDAVVWKNLWSRLVKTYNEVGRPVQAVVSGMVVLEQLDGDVPMPLVEALASACETAEMYEAGLSIVEELKLDKFESRHRAWILMHKAKMLLELNRPDAAHTTLKTAQNLNTPKKIAYQISAQIGEAELQRGNDQRVLSICRELLDGGKPTLVERQALSLLGRYYESRDQYLKATRVYEGQYWVSPDWEETE